MPRVINVVDHDPTWSAAFEQEAVALAGVFGRRLLRIYHIGSTPISGLCAKPIIDILIVLDQTGTINSFNAAMEALGYRPRGECLDATVLGTWGDSISARLPVCVHTGWCHPGLKRPFTDSYGGPCPRFYATPL
jgi:GrpB-like predicted nucleotidyltransferase (UPF0157 family)